jgi:uncharacterized membrane protein HdeD (DUF308 family)
MIAKDMNLSVVEINSLRSNWGWSLASGIALALIGLAAIIHSVTATLISLVALAWLMIFGGVALFVHGVRTRKWSGFLLDLFGAAMVVSIGILLLRNPLASVLEVTLLLGIYLIISGLAVTVGGFAGKYRSRGWAVFDGVISIILGAMLLASWPVSGLWFLGFAFGVKLLFMGTGLAALAIAAHSAPEERSAPDLRRAA